MHKTINNQTDKPANWEVLGAGAMGCLWAAQLALHGQSVNLLLRDEPALQRYRNAGGIRLDTLDGQPHHLPLAADILASNAKSETEPVQRLLLATKAQDSRSALMTVQHRLDAQSLIVLLHNGIEAQQEITAEFGSERVYCLSTSHGAWLKQDFHVCHAGAGESWLGSLSERSDRALQSLLSELPVTAMNIRHDPDIGNRLWRKLAINCAVNALTVLYRCKNGDLLMHANRFEHLKRLCSEIETIYAAIPDAPDLDDLLTQVTEVLLATAKNHSSTLQDARKGRPTEIPALNGFLRRQAARYRIHTPENLTLLAMLESLPDSHLQGQTHID